MPLDGLVNVIETLQQRILDHRTTLQGNETRTRMALIDPLLTALGWDVSDPALVTPEYSVDGGWADYALRGPGNQSAAIIEAKRLGTLVENHLTQMVNYCIQEGIAYAGVTDGNRWQLYRTFEPVPMADKIVLDVNISNAPAYECALKLLMLWRPNLSSGKAIPAEEPTLVPELKLTSASVPAAAVEPEETRNLAPTPSTLPPTADSWTALSSYDPPSGGSPPSAIRFPDGTENEVRFWHELVVHTVAWLWRQGALTQSVLPVRTSPRSATYIVNTEPLHQSGNRFRSRREVAGTPTIVEGHGSGRDMRERAKTLLNHSNVNAADVWLKVEP